ncbi:MULTISPECIES: tRNA1(Val) (adenine(37)-N6)-methyltransferase [unclassified Meridianimarinicoccus]|uniref:tRNA1(Val) (adenine(37)-N6)-methyltransferase n=1 Tax=unclassified Meridianimarinicoccus TaxID=2923344 RepID=UPI001868F673|nr:methyltransferase [Fluviibacterium sp. MJW13]
MTDDLTRDLLLGGRVVIWQPRKGFRAGVDAVLLAAAVPARPGQSVLELGCGVGTASLCLATRVPDLAVFGVELQPAYADLARRNATETGVDLTVATADIAALPADLRNRSFDHVLANPPYYQRSQGPASEDAGRDIALAGDTPLAAWVEAATRRLTPGGCLTMIQQADRLPDLLAALDRRLGAVEVLPLAPREGRPAHLVLLRAIKGRRTPFSLRAPLVLHAGPRHLSDAEDYRAEVADVFRNVAPLPGFSSDSNG